MNIARDNGMSFGTAVALLERGARVARKGWNGKGMFLFRLEPGEWQLVTDKVPSGLKLLPFIAMKTADDKIVPWLASQTDVLANDWCEVE